MHPKGSRQLPATFPGDSRHPPHTFPMFRVTQTRVVSFGVPSGQVPSYQGDPIGFIYLFFRVLAFIFLFAHFVIQRVPCWAFIYLFISVSLTDFHLFDLFPFSFSGWPAELSFNYLFLAPRPTFILHSHFSFNRDRQIIRPFIHKQIHVFFIFQCSIQI